MADLMHGGLVRHGVRAVRFGATWVRPGAVDVIEDHPAGPKLHLRGEGAVFLSTRYDTETVAERLWGVTGG